MNTVRHRPRVAFISTYVPRKCGIATYTRDLVEALIAQGVDVEVVAIDTRTYNFHYPSPVTAKIEQHEQADYLRVAQELNASTIDIVHIEHEFGIFGGDDGSYILDFARQLEKPFVVTFHTTVKTPSLQQLNIMKELARLSQGIITMKEIGKDRLINVYGMNDRDIQIIFHGVPDMDYLQKDEVRKKLGLHNTFLLMTSNLISSNKGIEYAIQALPAIVQRVPHAKLLIIGETHPQIKEHEGEVYRNMLQHEVANLHMQEHISFINEYLSLQELKEYFAAADIVLTPYLEPEQITSGTLAYGIGAGKLCISTPYIYAKNILKDNRGILVPFQDSQAIAQEVIAMYTHPKLRHALQHNAFTFGKEMRWPKIAKKHLALYKKILQTNKQRESMIRKYLKQPIDITYLHTLTSPIGIMQHTQELLLDNKHGYSTDDNARALAVVTSLYETHPTPELLALIKQYLSFLFFAQEENGKFHTFLGPDNTWLDSEDVTDAFGKTIWALGFFLYTCPDSPFAKSADRMFRRALPNIASITNIRTAAFALFGLYYYHKAFEDQKDAATTSYELLCQLANFLVQHYEQEQEPDWQWFEKQVTYDNFRLPQALFFAYLATGNTNYKKVAQKTLDFLLACNYDNTKHYFDFVGQDGWFQKEGQKALFDQQPLEAAAAVSSCLLAHDITREKLYRLRAEEAFAWFFGKNRNHTSLINEQTKGIYDGLTMTGVSENQGSESIVCFLLACISLQRNLKKG